MSAFDTVRDHLPSDTRPASAAIASEALGRIEEALCALTVEHGSQCQCPGCSVLREGA